MGTWGTGLYSDDTACDVRDDYKDILGDGIAEPDATDLLIEQWRNALSDPDISSVFWLVLADVQWNLGKLQEKVKQEAIKVIENSSDLIRWSSNQKFVLKRKVVLARLRRKLETSQPTEREVEKRYVNSTDWNIGDVFSFRLQSGLFALLHVIGFHQDKGGRGSVCEILEWTGEKVPNKQEIEKIGYKSANEPSQHLSQFLFGSLSPKEFQNDRVNFVIKDIKPKQRLGGYAVILWRSIDRQFDDLFGLK
ncbi:MAG: hypothetical protein P4L50_01195 [Anaerolineaceae bacterium]|nr:hypothetical protein [Anaerolineaceae bacterium]